MVRSFKPIFLVSLPRSGSTMLQKILMCHNEIASTGEPWLLLPLSHLQIKEGVTTRYGHIQSYNALIRLKKEIGDASLVDEAIRGFYSHIVSRYVDESTSYFLDKTPRYYLILDELARIFPDAKFIILVRNPLSIFASSIAAFKKGKLRRLDHLEVDFKVGPMKLTDFYQNNKTRCKLVRYDELVRNPEHVIKTICDYLDIDYRCSLVDEGLSKDIDGHGDHLGAKRFKKIMDRGEEWAKILDSPIRKWRATAYVNSIPDGFFQMAGFDKTNLIKQLRERGTIKLRPEEILFFLEEIAASEIKKISGVKNVS